MSTSPAGGSRKLLWLLLGVSLAFNAGVLVTLGVLVYSHRFDARGRDRDREHGPHLDHLIEELQLSPEQTAQVKELEENMRDRFHERRGIAREWGDQLAELLAAPEPDREAIDEHLAGHAEMKEDMLRGVINHFLEIKSVLTPEQQEQFNETIRFVFPHGGPGPGRHFGGPRGPQHRPGHGRRGERPRADREPDQEEHGAPEEEEND